MANDAYCAVGKHHAVVKAHHAVMLNAIVWCSAFCLAPTHPQMNQERRVLIMPLCTAVNPFLVSPHCLQQTLNPRVLTMPGVVVPVLLKHTMSTLTPYPSPPLVGPLPPSLNILSRKALTVLCVRVPVLSKQTMSTLAPERRALGYSNMVPALSSRVCAMCVTSMNTVTALGGAERDSVVRSETMCPLGVWWNLVAAAQA